MTAPTAVAEGISVAGVSKRFGRRDQVVHALHDVSIDIAPGEFVSLIGPSGCGKSTLLRVIGGLIGHDDGTVRVGDRSPEQARRQKRFGFVPQTPALLPWRTVIDNVSLLGEVNRRAGRAYAGESADPAALLAQVGLQGFERAHPAELSGGMQQRVALVRAFALGAPILLMDEPFAALDEITRAEMRYQLLDVWSRSGHTVVFVTHSIDEAVILSDRVVVLAARPGRITTVERIGLDRPRTAEMEDTDTFHHHVRSIRTALRAGWS